MSGTDKVPYRFGYSGVKLTRLDRWHESLSAVGIVTGYLVDRVVRGIGHILKTIGARL